MHPFSLVVFVDVDDLVKFVSHSHQDDDFIKHILDVEQALEKGVRASDVLLLEHLHQLALKVRLFEECDETFNIVDQSVDLRCVVVVLVKRRNANTVMHHSCLIQYSR